MMQISKIEEIAICMPEPARAEDLLNTIKARGIEVFAHCCVTAPVGALTRVVTDKPQQTKAVLEQAGLNCKTSPVVLVRTTPQTTVASQLGMQLTAAQIGLHYCYATSHEATRSHVVFKTTDDDHAIRVLQTCATKLNNTMKWKHDQQRVENAKRQAEHSW
jgi:hypothetical protein